MVDAANPLDVHFHSLPVSWFRFAFSTGDLGKQSRPFIEVDVSGPKRCIESLRRYDHVHRLIDAAAAAEAGRRADGRVVRAPLARRYSDVSATWTTTCP